MFKLTEKDKKYLLSILVNNEHDKQHFEESSEPRYKVNLFTEIANSLRDFLYADMSDYDMKEAHVHLETQGIISS